MSAKCAVVKANRKSSSSYTQHGLVQHQLNFEMPMCCALSSFLIRVAARLLLFLRRQLFFSCEEGTFSLSFYSMDLCCSFDSIELRKTEATKQFDLLSDLGEDFYAFVS